MHRTNLQQLVRITSQFNSSESKISNMRVPVKSARSLETPVWRDFAIHSIFKTALFYAPAPDRPVGIVCSCTLQKLPLGNGNCPSGSGNLGAITDSVTCTAWSYMLQLRC